MSWIVTRRRRKKEGEGERTERVREKGFLWQDFNSGPSHLWKENSKKMNA